MIHLYNELATALWLVERVRVRVSTGLCHVTRRQQAKQNDVSIEFYRVTANLASIARSLARSLGGYCL